MQWKIMPDIVKKQSISALKPDNTVYEAAIMMAKVNVAAIVVEDDKGLLTGIVTERDLTRRCRPTVHVPRVPFRNRPPAPPSDHLHPGLAAPRKGLIVDNPPLKAERLSPWNPTGLSNLLARPPLACPKIKKGS